MSWTEGSHGWIKDGGVWKKAWEPGASAPPGPPQVEPFPGTAETTFFPNTFGGFPQATWDGTAHGWVIYGQAQANSEGLPWPGGAPSANALLWADLGGGNVTTAGATNRLTGIIFYKRENNEQLVRLTAAQARAHPVYIPDFGNSGYWLDIPSALSTTGISIHFYFQ